MNPDVFKVRDGEVVSRTIAAKQRAVLPLPTGGTQETAVEAGRQEQPALTDAQAIELVRLGRVIEAHLGRPQDIEWCLVDDGFHIVQKPSRSPRCSPSRPVTTGRTTSTSPSAISR